MVGRQRGRAVGEREILDTALALLDAGGAEAATIRRIAAAVGVAPNAVYRFFPDGAAIGRALVERLLAAVDRGVGSGHGHAVGSGCGSRVGRGGDWRAGVEALALDLRRRLVAHPGAVPLLTGARLEGPHTRLLGEHLLGLLARGGLEPAAAARGAYVLVVYVLGAIALEVADTPHLGALPPEADRIAERRAGLDVLPARALPRTAASAGVIASWVGTEQFLWGLRRVLDGISKIA